MALKKYEGVFILLPPADEAALEARLEKISQEIVRHGGVVANVTRLGRNTLARPIRRRESGFYVLLAFELEPARLAELRERLKLNEEILRAQILVAAKRHPETTPAEAKH